MPHAPPANGLLAWNKKCENLAIVKKNLLAFAPLFEKSKLTQFKYDVTSFEPNFVVEGRVDKSLITYACCSDQLFLIF